MDISEMTLNLNVQLKLFKILWSIYVISRKFNYIAQKLDAAAYWGFRVEGIG